jgi:hypothetical protein
MFVVLVAAVAGCHKSGEQASVAATERKASENARRDLEHPLVRDADRDLDDLHEAAEEVRREREDFAEAAARERVQYKKTLAKEISSADKRVGELEQELARATRATKDNRERDVSAARGWRARLKLDLERLERIGESEWPDVKERIDRDLEDERPASVPRSLDKSYAI